MKKLYKIIFINELKEKMEFYAGELSNSGVFGLVEAGDIVFLNSSELILTPEDDKVKKMFKNVERTHIPINNILRIDEVNISTGTPIVRLYGGGDK